MKKVQIKVVNKSQNNLPFYETDLAAGCDVRAALELIDSKWFVKAKMNGNQLEVEPGGRVLIPTGLHVSIPEGYEIQCRNRSGQALKLGVIMTNGIGTIDGDYRGDIGIILTNLGLETFVVNPGDRIAQLVLNEVPRIEWVPVESLDETDRGEGGFGHTGTK